MHELSFCINIATYIYIYIVVCVISLLFCPVWNECARVHDAQSIGLNTISKITTMMLTGCKPIFCTSSICLLLVPLLLLRLLLLFPIVIAICDNRNNFITQIKSLVRH